MKWFSGSLNRQKRFYFWLEPAFSRENVNFDELQLVKYYLSSLYRAAFKD